MHEGLLLAMTIFPGLFADFPLQERPEISISKILMPLISGNPEKARDYVSLAPSIWANCVEKVSIEIRNQLQDYFAGYDDSDEHQSSLEDLRKLMKFRKPRKRSATTESEFTNG